MDVRQAKNSAVRAAQKAGGLMRQNLRATKRTAEVTRHDIKLELDVRAQRLIEAELGRDFPNVAVLGEEGVAGKDDAEHRWVVDPIDGTVNFAYGIPHACVSIALQGRCASRKAQGHEDGYETLAGVVYDPFLDELWTAIRGKPARLNGRFIHVSRRRKLAEAIVCVGFSKTRESLQRTLPFFRQILPRVRKLRLMGSAALGLTYVASGRFDAYIERGIRLWDIAAGGLILECAGGEFWREPITGDHAFRMVANNGLLRRKLPSLG